MEYPKIYQYLKLSKQAAIPDSRQNYICLNIIGDAVQAKADDYARFLESRHCISHNILYIQNTTWNMSDSYRHPLPW